jgi:sugar/nucleoside kinase (ribokinase family)
LEPLLRVLPHLDVYVPSFAEARHQTGEEDPRRIIARYREAGAPGLLGVKLGSRGVLLSVVEDEYIEVAPTKAPGEVVDTTGAGDCFLGGLLAGLIRGLNPADAGRLGSATGACCVTRLGATAGIRSFEETARLAGLK